MIARSWPLCAAMLLSLLVLPHSGQAAEFRTVKRPVQQQYIVVLRPQAARLGGEARAMEAVPDVARRMAAEHGAGLLRSYTHVLRGFAVRADDDALARLLADPRVEYVEEDGIAEASATQTGATWGIDRVDQWSNVLDGSYTYTSTAAGVHAYVIDTGILSTHSEFTGRIGNGYTAIADGRGTTDCHGHGTHVAGTIGGTTYGVAKGVTLHPVRVLACNGTGTWSQIIAGMDWVAANHASPAVANMSLGGYGDSAVDAAAANLTAAGVTLVVAAGNNGGDACAVSPARAPSAITVGSARKDNGRSYFSNYGACVDLYGPGSYITSAGITSNTATAVLSGTSMASPHVAGAAALRLAANPAATPDEVLTALRYSSALSVLATGSGARRMVSTVTDRAPPPMVDGNAPTITSLQCPASEGGNGTYYCEVQYTSSSYAAVVWPGPQEGNSFSGNCAKGDTVTVSVMVGNQFGSTTRSTSFACPSGIIR